MPFLQKKHKDNLRICIIWMSIDLSISKFGMHAQKVRKGSTKKMYKFYHFTWVWCLRPKMCFMLFLSCSFLSFFVFRCADFCSHSRSPSLQTLKKYFRIFGSVIYLWTIFFILLRLVCNLDRKNSVNSCNRQSHSARMCIWPIFVVFLCMPSSHRTFVST